MTTNRVTAALAVLMFYGAGLLAVPIVIHPQFERLFMFTVLWMAGGVVLLFGVQAASLSLPLRHSCGYRLMYFVGNGCIALGVVATGLAAAFVASPALRDYSLPTGSDANGFWVGVVAALVWLVGSTAYLSNREDDEPESAYTPVYFNYPAPVVATPINNVKLKVGADGELVQVAQTSEDGLITLRGMGSQATQVVYLEVGRYRLEYAFASNQPCAISLVSVDDVESASQRILQEAGAGSTTLAVQFSGRYVFEVRCPLTNVTWELRCWLL